MADDSFSNPDETVLSKNPYAEYVSLREDFKRKLEPALLAEIVRSSNHELDSKYLSIDECANLLRDNAQFRDLLLDCWKNGSFRLARKSGAYPESFAQKIHFSSCHIRGA